MRIDNGGNSGVGEMGSFLKIFDHIYCDSSVFFFFFGFRAVERMTLIIRVPQKCFL